MKIMTIFFKIIFLFIFLFYFFKFPDFPWYFWETKKSFLTFPDHLIFPGFLWLSRSMETLAYIKLTPTHCKMDPSAHLIPAYSLSSFYKRRFTDLSTIDNNIWVDNVSHRFGHFAALLIHRESMHHQLPVSTQINSFTLYSTFYPFYFAWRGHILSFSICDLTIIIIIIENISLIFYMNQFVYVLTMHQVIPHISECK